jgi:molybdopterin synthase sulfur carrier subunit
MASVWFNQEMREKTGFTGTVEVEGKNIRTVIANLEIQFPGISEVLIYEDDIMPGLSVIIDGNLGSIGVLEKVNENSEVHFLPALGGG